MQLIAIPTFTDNYIWLLRTTQQAIIIDPGDAMPVINYLQKEKCQPAAILLTHHHWDHTDGVALLKQHYPDIAVYGPNETKDKGINHLISDGDHIVIGTFRFLVIAVPGHTLGHVAYYCKPWLFCGDTLLSGGCGKIFEGTAQQLYHSLNKLASLPDDTQICCGHEYTLSNMKFAAHILPTDPDIQHYLHEVIKRRQQSLSTLPSLLSTEKKINIFLRCNSIKKTQTILPANSLSSPEILFATLRQLKNSY